MIINYKQINTTFITQMNNTFLIIVFLILSGGVYAQENKLPSEERLMQINDSIVKEGEQLYLSEIMSWRLTDLYFSRQHSIEEIGGSLVCSLNDSVCSALFANKELGNCIFEYRVNVELGTEEIIDSVRPLTDKEREQLLDKTIKMGIAVNQYGDSINVIPAEEGNLNWNLLHIDGCDRLYALQGVTKSGVIPFGNDYSFDFNETNEIVKFRRHHKSFLPLPVTTDKGEPALEVVHSHLRDNPFITATDICNFLLYGMPAGVEFFSVLSTYFNCYFKFSFSENKITVREL
jgi:hypothetical protein